MKLQGSETGRKGYLSIATEVSSYDQGVGLSYIDDRTFNVKGRFVVQIFEVAPSLFVVELRKAGGDTLEYHKVQCMRFLSLWK